MGIDYIDLYETSFKDLDATKLVISKSDRHLNVKGAEIVAQGLYEKLKPLKKYQNLALFNRAFDLYELLNDPNFIEEVDKKWSELTDELSIIKVMRGRIDLTVKRFKDKVMFQRNEDSDSETTNFKIYLDRNGEFLSWQMSSSKTQDREVLEFKNGFYHLVKYEGNSINVKSQRNFVLQAPQENINIIKLEENILFADPKVAEEKVFSNSYYPSRLLDRETQIFILYKIANSNKKLKRKLLNISLTEAYLDSKEVTDLLDENILFDSFMTWLRYGAKNYVDQLTKLISEKKPSSIALKAAAKYYSHIKDFEKLDKLRKENPNIFANSKANL